MGVCKITALSHQSVLGLVAAAAMCGSACADDQREYGKHLSGECTSCHKPEEAGGKIPSIIGLNADDFIAALGEFKDGTRTNPAMVSVAKSLNDEQIAALAAYFATLETNKTD